MTVLNLKGQVSEEEWKVRTDLAAMYRLTALYGWTDMIFTHISHRVPGPDHHFLINPYGMFFEEITASSLVKVDLDGEIIQQTPYFINPAGFTIHSAIHAARLDAQVVMHVHTDDGVAVSAQKGGLLPLSQTAMVVLGDLSYHDYEGIALDHGERARLVGDMGAARSMILRNHGTLTIGETAAECFLNMFFLERACTMQVRALSAGRDGVLHASKAAQEVVKGQSNRQGAKKLADTLVWPGLLRRLERENPGYAV